PDVPVVIGGLEASLRRFAHYDYWDDTVRRSILVDSGADLLLYGMGEHSIVELAHRMDSGEAPGSITNLRGSCYLAPLNAQLPAGAVSCASFDKVAGDKVIYAKATRLQLEQQDHVYGKAIVQKHGDQLVIQNPPQPPLTQQELDAVWELPFERYYHPSYEALGGVKAIEEVEFSIMHNRGCYGACNFCSITFHQGRVVSSRSHQSVLQEAEQFTRNKRFKGYIHDVGGPTANFRGPACAKQLEKGVCQGKKCLFPKVCPAIHADHSDYIALLRELRAIKGVKKVFIRSGLRYDYICADPSDEFLHELVEHHISGQLKVAPEHCAPPVLALMGKPPVATFTEFSKRFYTMTKRAGKEQYLVPYLMSSHPGCTLKDAVTLALYLKEHNLRPEQVQDFYPTPATASTCMFYTGLDPYTMEHVYVPTDPYEKKLQRALLQYFRPENRRLVKMALLRANRADLIGNGKECLIPPDKAFVEKQKYIVQRKETEQLGKPKSTSRYAKGKPKQRPKAQRK
ncbi:MAG: YgiQ family radical SAM protein, partial [Angelakisella sp.]